MTQGEAPYNVLNPSQDTQRAQILSIQTSFSARVSISHRRSYPACEEGTLGFLLLTHRTTENDISIMQEAWSMKFRAS